MELKFLIKWGDIKLASGIAGVIKDNPSEEELENFNNTIVEDIKEAFIQKVTKDVKEENEESSEISNLFFTEFMKTGKKMEPEIIFKFLRENLSVTITV